MTLKELDAQLAALPASPTTDEDFIARRELMERRIAVYNAIHNKPQHERLAQIPSGPLVEVFVPEGGAGAVPSKTIPGKWFYAEARDGRTVIKLPWVEFYAIATATKNSGAGPNGACWWEANPHLKANLPKNDPPPVPAGYQESR